MEKILFFVFSQNIWSAEAMGASRFATIDFVAMYIAKYILFAWFSICLTLVSPHLYFL